MAEKTKIIELFNKIGDLLGKGLPKDEIQMEEVATTDGKILVIEGNVAEGTAIHARADDGTAIPLENSDYVLADGQTITVIDGIITKVVGIVDQTPPPADESIIVEMDAQIGETIAAALDRIEKATAARFEAIENRLKADSKSKVEMQAQIDKFAKEPAKPATVNRAALAGNENMTVAQRCMIEDAQRKLKK